MIFNKNVINDSNYSKVASECCLISYFVARKFCCIFVLAIVKTNPFSHHLSKSNFIWTFSAFLYISETTHIIFIMYIIRSETFIEIDSLQRLKISRQTYATNLSKICVITFTVLTLC